MNAVESARKTVTRPGWLEPTRGVFEEVSHVLFESGVPSHFIGRRFRLDDEVTTIDTKNGLVLQFGTTGLLGAVGVEAGTGRVVEVIDPPYSPWIFVNTSLATFVDTLEAVAGRFPFYDTDADEDEIEGAADDLLRIIRRIDPPAARPDRYWSTFVDDARMGDLTTEAILAVLHHSDD